MYTIYRYKNFTIDSCNALIIKLFGYKYNKNFNKYSIFYAIGCRLLLRGITHMNIIHTRIYSLDTKINVW